MPYPAASASLSAGAAESSDGSRTFAPLAAHAKSLLRALAAVVCPLGVLVCDDVFGHPSFFWSALVLQLLSMAGCVALAGRAISKLLERARKE